MVLADVIKIYIFALQWLCNAIYKQHAGSCSKNQFGIDYALTLAEVS